MQCLAHQVEDKVLGKKVFCLVKEQLKEKKLAKTV